MAGYIIVAPYGSEKLTELCGDTDNLPLIYLKSEISRQPFTEGQASDHHIFLCEKNDYDDSDKQYYCKDIAEKALDDLQYLDFIYVVLPEEIYNLFLQQLAIAKRVSQGDVVVPPSKIIIENHNVSLEYKPDCVFYVRYLKAGGGYFPFLSRYFKKQTEETVQISADSQTEDALEIERLYQLVLLGDYSELSQIPEDHLKALELRAVTDEHYEIALKIKSKRESY